MKMKIKKILIFFIIGIIILTNISHAKILTLSEITTKINEYENPDFLFNLSAGSIKAVENGNTIVVSTNQAGVDYEITWTLNENILETSFDVEVTNGESEEGIYKTLLMLAVADTIANMNGYDIGYLNSVLGEKEYVLENDGLEMTRVDTDTNSSTTFKIDISKQMVLADINEVYVSTESIKEKLDNFNSYTFIAGNVYLAYSKTNSEIMIGQKDGLNEAAYKSALSYLEAKYNSEKVLEHFKSNYSSFSLGNKDFDGFDIELNPSDVTQGLEGYVNVKIKINDSEVQKIINGNATVTPEIDELPNAGEENNIMVTILSSIIIVSAVGVIYIVVKNKKTVN